jgi:hypothetical protein
MEQTTNWRAGCGRSASPVRRGERGKPMSRSYLYQAVGRSDSWEGPSSGMAQDSAAKRRYGDGGIGKIIPRGSCGELVAGFLDGVVSGSGSAFSVMDIWGMRDDAPPSGRRAATHGRAILWHGPFLHTTASRLFQRTSRKKNLRYAACAPPQPSGVGYSPLAVSSPKAAATRGRSSR